MRSLILMILYVLLMTLRKPLQVEYLPQEANLVVGMIFILFVIMDTAEMVLNRRR